eukprot:CAMPEP_0201478878 /NCGR_PEP_ID=MMETSP0151_2-20130828/3642_1 /ASSEMBLY_ACC=CAM_ASM_000257 /TAXON_ID=200890 /ORGANISM="Paramoeba atlantica, Strain 621/1 / CCAP 1560/9" /LENGTH=48 /DNA_ID= /DNA_START= /DNA_END= /DNA_ORIENTATION=
MGEEGEGIRKELRERYQHDTVPAVFLKGEFVGGCDSTMQWDREGKLHL